MSFLLAGAIGIVVSARWTAWAWILMAVAIAPISLVADGNPGTKALALMGTLASYNAGLFVGLMLSYLQLNLRTPKSDGGAETVPRNVFHR